MTRKFPCPYCKGKGGYRGTSDMGGKLEPDEPCGVCGEGWGMIEIGGPEHLRLKQHIADRERDFQAPQTESEAQS